MEAVKEVSRSDIELLARYRLSLKAERQYIEDNRLDFFLKPHEELQKKFPDLKYLRGPNQLQAKLIEAWKDTKKKVFTFTGANRVGKTLLGIVIGLETLQGEWKWLEDVKTKEFKVEALYFPHKKPRKVRYIGQDWEKHIKSVVVPGLREWWPKQRSLEIKKNTQGIESLWIDVKTGSSLEIMSNKQESELHEGWEGDLIIYDEPPKRDIRVANARGLIDRLGRELFCMTLLSEAWVHREVIKGRDKEGRPDMTVFNVNGDISYNLGFGLTQEGIDQFAKTLKPEQIEARLKGKPAYLKGLIFLKFDRDTHVKERFPVPLDWPVDIAIDYHPRKPWDVQFVATDRINRKWVIDEIHEHGNYKYIAEEIIRRIRYQNLRVENIVCDPLAKGDPQSDLQEEDTFTKISNVLFPFGYVLNTASKDENGGITAINELLITENKEPALFVFNHCVKTIEQMEGWMWIEGKPAKEDEDMCENLYRVVLLDTRYSEMNQKTRSSEAVNWKIV